MLARYSTLAIHSIPFRLSCFRSLSSVAVEVEATPVTSAPRDRPRPPKKFKVEGANINDAFGIMKQKMWAKFDETVEAIVCLNVDPRKPNQSIRGVASLPHGVGKTVSVAVFARDADAQAAIDAGADIVGAEDLIARIQAGDIQFQRAIATPDVMPLLAKIGKVRFQVILSKIGAKVVCLDLGTQRPYAKSQVRNCDKRCRQCSCFSQSRRCAVSC